MERGEPPHEVALVALEAVALEHDGLDGAAVVVAGREHGHGERALPPVQEREQVVHEGEAAVGGEGDGLVAVERLGAADVVVEDPVLLAPAGCNSIDILGTSQNLSLILSCFEF